MLANGIDMFHGDNREDLHLSDDDLIAKFQAMRGNGIYWIMHKVTEGLHFVDPKYTRRRKLALQSGMKFFGGYHFLSNDDPVQQAQFFVENSSDDGAMGFACDFERGKSTPALHIARTFMMEVNRATGARCKIYGSDLLRECLQKPKGNSEQNTWMFFAKTRLWLAEYGPHENTPWPWNDPSVNAKPWAWQFTEKGVVPEIVGKTDLNFFAGSEADMALCWRL